MAKEKMVKVMPVIKQIYNGRMVKPGTAISVEENEAKRLLKKPRLFSPVLSQEPPKSKPDQVE